MELPSRYQAIEPLGKGGGGEVWAVRDRYTGQRYALKALAPEASEHEMQALVREAAALSGLEGLGVPRVVRFGRLPHSGRAFLVRELVSGSSLEDMIASGAGLERVIVAIVAAADQLTVLHRAGLFHGDVKPANVIVEPGGRTTFVDLGLAAPWQEGGSLAQGLTPRYAAPELLSGGPLTARAEVYALGVTLAEAIEHARTSGLGQEVIEELSRVVTRATAQSAHERYPSADEFASALRRAVGLTPDGSEPEREIALWPVIGIDAISGELLECARALSPSGLLRLTGMPGSGRSALIKRLGWSLGADGQPVIQLDPGAAPSEIVSELSAVPSIRGAFLLLDDADGFEPSALNELKRAKERGARVVAVGGQQLGVADREIQVPPLDTHLARDLIRRVVPSLGDSLLDHIVEAAGGRPGDLRRLVRLIASEAVVSTKDVESLIRGVARDGAVGTDPLERAVYFLDRGRFLDAQAALVELPTPSGLDGEIARARLDLGLGDPSGALQRLLPFWERDSDSEELALCLGRAYLALGDEGKALELLLPLSKRPTALGAEGQAYHAWALSLGGRHQEALDSFDRALARSVALNAPRVEAIVLVLLGFALQRADRTDDALRVYQESIGAAERAGDASTLAVVRDNLAGLLKVRGDIQGAIEQFEAALDMGRRSGRGQTVRQALLNLANLDIYLGRFARASARIEMLQAQQDQLPPLVRAQLVGLLADLHARQNQHEQAVVHYQVCADAFALLDRRIDAAEARLEAAVCASRASPPNLGLQRELVQRARVELGDTSAHRPLLELASSRISQAVGDEQRARAEVDAALAAARETNQREWVWRALEARAELEEHGGQPLLARRDREDALAVLEEIGARLPRDLREVYWSDPRRASARASVPASIGNAPTQFSPFQSGARFGEPSSFSTTGSVTQSTSTPLEQRLARVLEVNAELAGEHDLARLTERITDYAVELARAERGFVLLYDEREQLIVYTSRAGGGDAASHEFSRSIAETVIRTREPMVTLNAQDDMRMSKYASVHQMHLQSVACLPILDSNRRAVGALYVETRLRPGAQFERELPTLRAFADQVAIALENARLIGENRRRAEELERTNRSLEEAQLKLRELLGDRTEQLKRARRRLRDVRDTLYGHFGYHGLVGTSQPMRRVYALIERVKDTDVPVLITGESGTGKEMIARAIHEVSARSKAKMLGVNCGAIPENLLESELFGHVKGAFTGADRERRGLFRECDGGTILLDEIGETPAKMQSTLLRVLQERVVRPVGGSQEVAVDARVLFATNRDLQALVRSGKFREDLYYRIHVVEIRVPALRERAEDVPQLVDHFLGLFAARYKREKKTVSREGLRWLCEREWPGNVRELEHVLLNAWVLSEDQELTADDFALDQSTAVSPQASGHGPSDAPGLRASSSVRPEPRGTTTERRRNERERILHALSVCNWNRVKAAEFSGIPRRTFYRRLREYGIQ